MCCIKAHDSIISSSEKFFIEAARDTAAEDGLSASRGIEMY